MSNPAKIQWTIADEEAVCEPQTTAAAGKLIINGTLSTNDSSGVPYAVFAGVIRKVSLTSTGNLSGIQFTIVGYSGQTPITEVINGPNNNTVETANFFSTIISVSANAAVTTNVSVGTGLSGFTNWYFSDYHRSFNALTVAVLVIGTIDYSFHTTLDNPNLIQPLILEPIDGFTIPTVPINTPMINATIDCIANYTFPTVASRIAINSSDGTGGSTIYFLQQGLK